MLQSSASCPAPLLIHRCIPDPAVLRCWHRPLSQRIVFRDPASGKSLGFLPRGRTVAIAPFRNRAIPQSRSLFVFQLDAKSSPLGPSGYTCNNHNLAVWPSRAPHSPLLRSISTRARRNPQKFIASRLGPTWKRPAIGTHRQLRCSE
jgi:hypothetical protein